MKKNLRRQERIPISIPDGCKRFYPSHGFNFLVQTIQLAIGGITMCIPIVLLCPAYREIGSIFFIMFSVFILACGIFTLMEEIVRRRKGPAMVGINDHSIYLRDGLGMILSLDKIVAMHYQFGQFRKHGAYPCLILYQKSGLPMCISLPSISLCRTLQRAVPSVRITANYFLRLILCVLVGIAIGISAVLLVFLP